MEKFQRSGSRSASPRRPRTADGGLRDSRSHSRSRKSRERKETHRPVKEYSRSRSRSVSRGRKSYRSSKYASAGHRGSSRSRSRSPYRGGRYSRSRSRSYSRSRYSRERDRNIYRSHSRSPMSSRRRHVGNRDNPCPSRCLGVFGLSIFTTEQQIHHIFSKYGPVERVQVVIDAKVFHSVLMYCSFRRSPCILRHFILQEPPMIIIWGKENCTRDLERSYIELMWIVKGLWSHFISINRER